MITYNNNYSSTDKLRDIHYTALPIIIYINIHQTLNTGRSPFPSIMLLGLMAQVCRVRSSIHAFLSKAISFNCASVLLYIIKCNNSVLRLP